MTGYWFEFEGEWYEILEAAEPESKTQSVYVHTRKLDKSFQIMRLGDGEKIYTLNERTDLEQHREREKWIDQSRPAAPVFV